MENKIYITRARYEAYLHEIELMEGESMKKLAELLAASPGSGMGRPNDLPIHTFASDYYNYLDKIKKITNRAIIIDEIRSQEINPKKVVLGSTVEILFPNDEQEAFVILGEREADTSKNRISYLSPIGSSLLGHEEGDKITVTLFSRKIDITIVSVKQAPLNFEYDVQKMVSAVNIYSE